MSEEREHVEMRLPVGSGPISEPSLEKGEGAVFITAVPGKEQRLRAYAEWLATPKASREPRTKASFAELWGVGRTTLWNDEQDAWLQSEILRRQRSEISVSNLQDVIKTLVSQATDPDNVRSVQAAKLLFDFMGAGDEQKAAANVAGMTTEAMRDALAVIEAAEA